ncbi:hypothetical protein [Dokdonella sp.]|uniref:hypothetical protein n=1 Tax=Dokdonella sp. TaxID=2291710 RepID=UPI003526CB99
MTRKKDKGQWKELDGGASFAIPLTLIRHLNFRRLSPHSNKLVLDLGTQYTGFNNGYLCCSWSLMKDMGWNSSNTLRAAMLELEHYRIIVRTQQGGLNKPNLFAFTFRKIDEKRGHDLEIRPTLTPSNAWKRDGIPDFQLPEPKRRRRSQTRLEAMAA